eukprot:scaffold10881_cov138-Cylindrotheca_fusiformis.AAC.2
MVKKNEQTLFNQQSHSRNVNLSFESHHHHQQQIQTTTDDATNAHSDLNDVFSPSERLDAVIKGSMSRSTSQQQKLVSITDFCTFINNRCLWLIKDLYRRLCRLFPLPIDHLDSKQEEVLISPMIAAAIKGELNPHAEKKS